MPEGEGTFLKQFFFLIFLILRLKSWKFMFWLLVIPAIFINFLLYKDIEKGDLNEVNEKGVTELTMRAAMSHKNLIQSNTPEETSLKNLMSGTGRKAAVNDWVESCESEGVCKSRFVQSVVSRSSEVYSIMKYGKGKLAIHCLSGGLSQILCPFLYHAMSQSLEYSASPDNVFKEVTFAKYYDKAKDSGGSKYGTLNISTPDSMCTRTFKSFTYIMKFVLYILAHMLVMTAAFVLNLTVGTLSSISNLKENGFLQLIFNNGLSVGAYWLAFWFIATVEALAFTSLFILSYSIQCPGFYSTEQLINLFIYLMTFFISISAVGFLFATMIQSFFIILMLMILVQLMFTVVMAIERFIILNKEVNQAGVLMSMLLLFPPGHIVEICMKHMLPMAVLKPEKEFDTYFQYLEPMMLATPIVLVIVTIYLDFIVRNGNGLCLPWGFPFNPNFWNPHRQKLIEMVDTEPKRANVEPTVGVPAVIASDIFMTYPAGCCAAKSQVLHGVTCTVYQGQITALIGHNGAGKTTLIRVLMGEEIPTSGLAVINGHRVTDPYQRLALRGSVSICKQVDVLSNYLTVMESMKLTLVAKGFSSDSQVKKVLDMLKRLGLEGKENVQAMDLSGGQMRKVCSIICLLGNPRLVILDEPTSGLDPVSRRNLWQILKDHRAGRSIILCTQFMDEADILADRKMFLSAGKLICAGSSLFLKQAFGCCVSINVSLKSENQSRQLMKLLKKVKLISQYQTELVLQVSAEKPQILANAVQTLEQHPELVDAFGVSQAQLDDIFMRLKFIDMDNIEESFKSKKLRKLGRGANANIMVDRVDFSSLYNFENRKPIHSSLGAQFSSLMRMNLSRQWKAKMKFCFRLIFPLLLVAAIAFLGAKLGSDDDKPAAPERNQTIKTSESDPTDDSKDAAAKSQKSVVLHSMSDMKLNPAFLASGGLCIYDKISGNETDQTKQMLHICQLVFNRIGASVHEKDKNKLVSDVVQENGALGILRRRCRQSGEKQAYSCFYAYASSWDVKSPNKDRSIYLGFYENPADSPTPEINSGAIQLALDYYINLATYFSSYEQSTARNFTRASAFQALTFGDMNFMDCYELIAYVSAFALIPVTYMNDPIEDKDSGVRQHLASIGMSTLAYWFNTFILHWAHYIVCFALTSAACLTMQRYQNSFFFVYLVIPVMFVGTTSSQLSVYVISAMMKKTNAIVLVLYFFVAMFLGIVVIYVQDKYMPLIILICVLPPLTPVAYLIIGMKVVVYSMLFFDVKDASLVPDLQGIFLSSDILMICLTAMPVHILILIGLITIVENPGAILNACKRKVEPSKDVQKPVKDEGVKLEADRINKSVRSAVNMLEVRDLQKVYPNGVRAVRGTTFGTLAGEIIGLLGPNGAGKTTTMSIIVGEEASSSGSSEVHFADSWMSGIAGAQCGAIGYCPQHNPLFNSISVFEHLDFYARIRGIPPELAQAQIAGLIDGLGLKPHREKAAEQLSGGNKRRLCLAIALLGNPSLIVIDEASTGVDPENKRFIWSAIRGMATKQRSVMITTHSMEEVEALCARVGIMNKGVMIGFGTVQQLRSRHGEAYTLDVMMKAKKPLKLEVKKKKLAKRILKEFKNATVMEDLMRCVQFNLPRKNIASFSGAMRWLIGKKKSLGIQFFTLYQMSLDQVFVKLVKEYDES